MDTYWMAVDQDGHVAQFAVDNNPVPRLQVQVNYADAEDVYQTTPSFANYYVRDLYDRLSETLQARQEWQDVSSRTRELLQTDDLLLLIQEAIRDVRRREREHVQTFAYCGDYGCIGYQRGGRPPLKQVHISQYSPFIRFVLQQVCFDRLCFADTEQLFPLDWGPCWWSHRGIRRVVEVDGEASPQKVVPVHGREKEFLEEYKSWSAWAFEEGYDIQPAAVALREHQAAQQRCRHQPWGWCAKLDEVGVLSPRPGWEAEFVAAHEELHGVAELRDLKIIGADVARKRHKESARQRSRQNDSVLELLQDIQKWLPRFQLSLQPHGDGTALPFRVRRAAAENRILGVNDGVLQVVVSKGMSVRKALLNLLELRSLEWTIEVNESQDQLLVHDVTPEELYQRIKEPLKIAKEESLLQGTYPRGP